MGLVHEILGQAAKPKVQLSYDLGNANGQVNLPFLLGVIGDFSMASRDSLAPLAQRAFLTIDRDNFDQVMSKLAPALCLDVPCTLAEAADDSMLEVNLRFESLRDFEPLQVAQKIPALKRLLEKRASVASSTEASPRRVEAELDMAISKQVAAVMHHPDFQKLEGSWRGLHYLVTNTTTGPDVKLRVLSCSKRELLDDFVQAGDFQASRLYEICDDPFCSRGDTPYSAIIVDFEFSHHADDLQVVRELAQIGADAQCLFVTAASSQLFGLSSWGQLSSSASQAESERRSQSKASFRKEMESIEYAAWRSLRKMEEARFVVMILPRVLARAPYESDGLYDDNGEPYCWMSAAFVYGAVLTDAFSQYGWCTAIQGHEFGVAQHLSITAIKTGEAQFDGSTEVVFDDVQEAELGMCGLLPLCQTKRLAIFFGAQTVLKSKQYEGENGEAATANAAISTRVPFVMATSRFAHYLRAIVRDKAESFPNRSAVEQYLNRWISQYVQNEPKPTRESMARWPLADAKIELSAIPNSPDFYSVVAYLRPVLLFEELTASIRVAFVIPAVG